MDSASPKTLIVVAAVIGFFIWGIPGAVVGAIGGFILTVSIGLLINHIQGGVVPRKVRRDLVTNVISNYSDDVNKAFPDLSGNELLRAIEGVLDRIVKRAVTLAPTHDAICAEGPMYGAILELFAEELSAAKGDLLIDIKQQLAEDWYPPRGF